MNLTFNVNLRPDRTAAELAVIGDKGQVATATLDAADCDGLLDMLQKARADLADVIPMDLEPNARVSPLFDPKWQLGDSPEGEILLAVRHPGFGWITIMLPKNEAAALADGLDKLTAT